MRRVAPPALAPGVGERRCVVVLACDHNDLVPDARIDDPVAVHLSSEALLVDVGKSVTCAVHTPASVAPTDDRHNLACLLVVVSRDKLRQRLVRRSAAQKGNYVRTVAPPLVLANRLAESEVNGAFRTRRTDEDAVARVVLARSGPSVRLALPPAPARHIGRDN